MNVFKRGYTQRGFNALLLRKISSVTERRRVVVTGIGAVTPLANDFQNSWLKVLAGESAITNLDDSYKGLPCQVAAQISKETLQLEKHFTKSDLKIMSSATVLSILAAQEAMESAHLNTQALSEGERERIGACVGMGMFDLSEVYGAFQQLQRGYNRVSPYFVPRILPNMACGHISMRFGLRGPNHSVSTACATGAHAIGDALRFIRNGDSDIMLAGSGESCIDPLSIAGFCRLRALSTNFNNTPAKASRPFDAKRDGFVMGEGAAIIVLEELEHALQRKAPILAELLGYGLSGDAYHITSPSEDGTGAYLAMQRALQDAGMSTTDVSYVNAHATSTPTGDKIESHAITRLFKDSISNIRVSSTKGAHGHLLGSSGNLEAVFTIKACAENVLPPSINIEKIGEGININLVKEAQAWCEQPNSRRIAIKNSFGFGGTNASLCIASFKN